MNKRVCKAYQIKFIMKCRRSGLSDYQWCEQNVIHVGAFYNWVSKLKKNGYTFPKSQSRTNDASSLQDVVKVDMIDYCSTSSQIVEQNTSILASGNTCTVAAELLFGNITLRLYNDANEKLIQNVLRCIGGTNHNW